MGVVFHQNHHISDWVVFLLEPVASVSFCFIMNHFSDLRYYPSLADQSFIVEDDLGWKLSVPFVAHVACVTIFFNSADLKVYSSITYLRFSRKSGYLETQNAGLKGTLRYLQYISLPPVRVTYIEDGCLKMFV